MRATITLCCLALLLVGCSSVKRNQKFLSQGNYDQVIALAVKKLRKDKTAEKYDAHISLLEQAYKKAANSNMRKINSLKKEDDPAVIREIYQLYLDLNNQQELIRPLLPLYSESLGRNAKFKMKDYSADLISSKKALLEYLYDEADIYMRRQTIADYRTAYHIYCELDELQSNFRDVHSLKQDARFYGTDFVFVRLNNRSGILIPHRLERELLNFNTYGLDAFWTEYHSERQQHIDYNYGISINFKEIGISPERITEKEIIRAKQVKIGWEYQLDREGNILNDENGDPIKKDVFDTVTARLILTKQTKAVYVGCEVVYRDLIARRDLDYYPLTSEFIFENVFATYSGDQRALTDDDWKLIDNHFVYFPTNEQMVLDAGEDIKIRIKEILRQHPFP